MDQSGWQRRSIASIASNIGERVFCDLLGTLDRRRGKEGEASFFAGVWGLVGLFSGSSIKFGGEAGLALVVGDTLKKLRGSGVIC